jgi:sulfotransferase famil protein
MPILSRSRRFLFLMAPQTACTAVGEGVLIPLLGGRYFPERPILDDAGSIVVGAKHATLQELRRHGLLSEEEAARLFKFTTVRNPFDSLVTQYVRLRTKWKDLIDDPESFVNRKPRMRERIRIASEIPTLSEWVDYRLRVRGPRQRLRRPLSRYRRPRHMYRRYLDGADFVMRYERLQEDLNQVLETLGVAERLEIPRINVTETRTSDYRSYYTPRARAIVERVYAPDLERFGYAF